MQEKVLLAMFETESSGIVARNSIISNRSGIYKPDVTNIVTRLSSEGMCWFEPRVGIGLTYTGTEIAKAIFDKVEIIRSFLEKTLQLPREKIEQAALSMYNVVDNDVLDKMRSTM